MLILKCGFHRICWPPKTLQICLCVLCFVCLWIQGKWSAALHFWSGNIFEFLLPLLSQCHQSQNLYYKPGTAKGLYGTHLFMDAFPARFSYVGHGGDFCSHNAWFSFCYRNHKITCFMAGNFLHSAFVKGVSFSLFIIAFSFSLIWCMLCIVQGAQYPTQCHTSSCQSSTLWFWQCLMASLSSYIQEKSSSTTSMNNIHRLSLKDDILCIYCHQQYGENSRELIAAQRCGQLAYFSVLLLK